MTHGEIINAETHLKKNIVKYIGCLAASLRNTL